MFLLVYGRSERRAPRPTQRYPRQRARVAKEICIPQLNLLSQSVEDLVNLKVVVKDGGVCVKVAHGDALVEHVPILHIHSQPHHETMVLCDEVS